MLVLVIPASSEVQGGAPTVPLPSVAIRIATDCLLWTQTFSSVAFVNSSDCLSLMYLEKPYRIWNDHLLRVHKVPRRTRTNANNKLRSCNIYKRDMNLVVTKLVPSPLS